MNTHCTTNTTPNTAPGNAAAGVVLARDAVRFDVADSLRARGFVQEAQALLDGHPARGVFLTAAMACRRAARRREFSGGQSWGSRRIMLPAARACVALARGHAERAARILAGREGVTVGEWVDEATNERRERAERVS